MDADAGFSRLGDEGPWPTPSHLSILENLQLLQLLACPKKPHLQIRSDSALAMYRSPQPSATGKYTVYDADGSTLELDIPLDDGKSSKTHRPLAKFFHPEVTKMIFSTPETRARLAQFLDNFIAGPERKQCVADMKFLDKVCSSSQILPRNSQN
jgi:hypothetical protein